MSEDAGKTGWFRTWPDKSEKDGLLWREGFKMGRVHDHWDGRWFWNSWCGDCGGELADTKEEAKAEVERRADLSKMTLSCVTGSNYHERRVRFDEARERYKSAAK